MSRFAPVRPGGQWPPELVPTKADYRRWDVAQSKLVNAAAGGSWNPTKSIAIGGAGISLDVGASMVGGVTIGRGSTVTLLDIPEFIPSRSRTITIPLHELPFDAANCIVSATRGGTAYTLRLEDYLELQVFPVAGLIPTNLGQVTFPIPKRFLHHILPSFPGGPEPPSYPALSQMALRFRVLMRPDALPQQMGLTVLGRDESGTAANPVLPFPSTWTALTAYTLGQYVYPNVSANPFSYFRCTTAGTSAAGHPTWNLTPGSTTTESTGVTWRCIGGNGQFYSATPDSYYLGGTSQILSVAFDPNIVGSPTQDCLDCSANRYMAVLSGMPTDGSILLESLQASFVHIGGAAFE